MPLGPIDKLESVMPRDQLEGVARLFCELALRALGKTGVQPWTKSKSENGVTFFPLVTGIFGGDDTAASIFLALGEILERDMDKPCEAGARSMGRAHRARAASRPAASHRQASRGCAR